MDQKIQQQVLDYINRNRAKYLEELAIFCKQPSIATQNRGMLEMSDLVQERLEKLGFRVNRVRVDDGHPILLAELRSKAPAAKTVLIYNHYDVQPETPVEEWESDPFELTAQNGKLYARGVSDNKGDLLSRLQVIEAFLQVTKDVPVNVKWLVEGEEEIGSPSLVKLQQEHGEFWADSDVCIWEEGWVNSDGAAELALGMKGDLYVELTCEYNKSDLHSRLAVVADNPVWELLYALNTLRAPDGSVSLDGFYADALSPSSDELALLGNKQEDIAKSFDALGVEKLLESPSNKIEFYKKLYFGGTATISGIWAGYTGAGVKTIVPNKASAKIDFRLVPNQDPDDIEHKLRAHLDNHGFVNIKIKPLVKLKPTKTPLGDKYVQLCLDVFEDVYKKKPVVEITSLGGGPTYSVAAVYSIPTVKIGVGYPGTNAHAPNENIREEDYFRTMEVLVKYFNLISNTTKN